MLAVGKSAQSCRLKHPVGSLARPRKVSVKRDTEWVSERIGAVAINKLSKPTWSAKLDVSMTLKVRGADVFLGV